MERPSEDGHQRGPEDPSDCLPDLLLAHHSRISHSSRAVEHQACNYGDVG
jgi:hypothetical protein